MDQLVEAMEDVNQHLNNTNTASSRPATAAADASDRALVTVPLPPEGSRRRPASASARACPSRSLTSSLRPLPLLRLSPERGDSSVLRKLLSQKC